MESFAIGSARVYPYGLALAAAAAFALLYMTRQAKRDTLKSGTAGRFALLALPLGLIGARLGYCLVSIDWVLEHGIGSIFQLTRGGFMLYGALLGCVAAAALVGRITSQPAGAILDAFAAPAAFMTAAARFAEPLAGMGCGRNITDWFDPWMEQSMIAWEDPSALFRFPFALRDHYGEWNFNIALLEALTALVIMVVCARMKRRRAGGRFLFGALIYAAMQIMLESMRQDAVLRWGFVRADQLLSAVAVVAAAVVCLLRAPGRRAVRAAAVLGGEICLIGLAMAMEFALESKIDFLVGMRMDVCYLVMFVACVLMIVLIAPVWKAAFPVRGEQRRNPVCE